MRRGISINGSESIEQLVELGLSHSEAIEVVAFRVYLRFSKTPPAQRPPLLQAALAGYADGLPHASERLLEIAGVAA